MKESLHSEGNDALPRQAQVGNPVGYEFVSIPAEVLKTGEVPAKVGAFELGKYEVTVGQYRKFCQRTGRQMPQLPAWASGNKQPIIHVTWEDASAFCQWIGGRLPTQVEWEYAARGGLRGKKFVWGDEWPPPHRAGNFADISMKKAYSNAQRSTENLSFIDGYDDGYAYTAPIGSFLPNGYGLYDMAGNAAEWLAEKDKRFCGGSFGSGDESELRVDWAYRLLGEPTDDISLVVPVWKTQPRFSPAPVESIVSIGFRVVRNR